MAANEGRDIVRGVSSRLSSRRMAVVTQHIKTLSHQSKASFTPVRRLNAMQRNSRERTASRGAAPCIVLRSVNIHCVSLEIATPTRRPFSGHGCHALSWRSHGHSLVGCLWRHLRDLSVLRSRTWRHRAKPMCVSAIAAVASKRATCGRGYC